MNLSKTKKTVLYVCHMTSKSFYLCQCLNPLCLWSQLVPRVLSGWAEHFSNTRENKYSLTDFFQTERHISHVPAQRGHSSNVQRFSVFSKWWRSFVPTPTGVTSFLKPIYLWYISVWEMLEAANLEDHPQKSFSSMYFTLSPRLYTSVSERRVNSDSTLRKIWWQCTKTTWYKVPVHYNSLKRIIKHIMTYIIYYI